MNQYMTAAESNMEKLKNNVYPGRGIVMGKSPDGKNFIQIYWIMGRSDNSRNRIFTVEEDCVKIEAFDESKVKDPSLIIYYPVKVFDGCHIVSNGDQTDTIYEALRFGGTFEGALYTREFEPDAPNYTPRISGIIDLNDRRVDYKLSILKTSFSDPSHCERQFFCYSRSAKGIGHCITTYQGDGDPLPSFCGEPFPTKLFDNIDQVTDIYWNLLNQDNRVSMLVKFIGVENRKTDIRILNKNLGD